MMQVKRILTFTLVLALALSMLAVPAAASSMKYIPHCFYCNSANLTFVRRHEYKTSDGVTYYVENEYVCRDCGKTTFVDLSLFD